MPTIKIHLMPWGLRSWNYSTLPSPSLFGEALNLYYHLELLYLLRALQFPPLHSAHRLPTFLKALPFSLSLSEPEPSISTLSLSNLENLVQPCITRPTAFFTRFRATGYYSHKMSWNHIDCGHCFHLAFFFCILYWLLNILTTASHKPCPHCSSYQCYSSFTLSRWAYLFLYLDQGHISRTTSSSIFYLNLSFTSASKVVFLLSF